MEQAKTRERLKRAGLFAAGAPCLAVLLQALVFLLVFRRALPNRVLAYLLQSFVSALASGIFLAGCLPEQANLGWAARTLTTRSLRTWQILYLINVLLLTPAVAALESFTFQSAAYGQVGFLVGLLLQIAGFFLLHLARMHNSSYAYPLVIPDLEASKPCASGPYRRLRHPGYLAMALTALAAPLLLGSLMASFPAVASVLLLIYRTGEEDSYLGAQLPGYQDYQARVKHRFLPGIW